MKYFLAGYILIASLSLFYAAIVPDLTSLGVGSAYIDIGRQALDTITKAVGLIAVTVFGVPTLPSVAARLGLRKSDPELPAA